MTLLSLTACFLYLSAWPFARSTRASGAVAIMAAVSFVAFLACAWCAAGPAIDVR